VYVEGKWKGYWSGGSLNELLVYRQNLMDRILIASQEFCTACRSVKDIRAPIEEGWNTHQLAAHTRDVDKMVYGLRTRRTVEEDNPMFESFDADAHNAQNYYPNESLDKILDEFMANMNAMANWLRGLPQASWGRESSHVTLGSGFTMQVWVERGLAHIEEHLASVNKARVNTTQKNPTN
jgi:hypothetical protein